MNFLTPLFLLGALAVAGPILYHLVRRATRERVRFSSLLFLEPSPPRVSHRHRVEHWLLLLLRCFALLVLALGFARPFLPESPAADPSATPPRRVVVLLDRSASMRREGLWEDARARVRTLLERAAPSDQVALVVFDRSVETLLDFRAWNQAAPGERRALAEGRLAALQPGWAGTQLGRALAFAADLLAEDEPGRAPGPRQIVLVSDLQEGSRLESLQAFDWPRGVELLLEAVAVRTTTNAGLQLLSDATEGARTPAAKVRVRVANAAGSREERFALTWRRPGLTPAADGPAVGEAIEAYVPPGQTRTFALARPAGAKGDERLVLSGDEDAFDNTLHWIAPGQERPLVLWVGAEPLEDPAQPLFFLRRAFAETPRVAVRVEARPPAVPLAASDLAAARLTFVSALSGNDEALRAALADGGTVVVLLRGAGAGEGEALGRLAGTPAVPLRESRADRPALWAEVDFGHPLLAPFTDARFSDFSRIRVWRHRELDPASLPGARVLVRLDSGHPLLVEVPRGRGRLLLWTSGWHPADSQLALSSKFVPLLWSLLEASGGTGGFNPQYAVGDPVPLPAAQAAGPVRGPGGENLPLTPGQPFTGGSAPGVYTVGTGATALRLAVNVDPAESRTAPLGADELERLGVPVSRASLTPAAPVTPATLLGAEAEGRQKLWRWLVAAALFVLLAETLLAGRAIRPVAPSL
ncbi:MAG: VWA domain-containing protein [Verrucomicrobia bacterium]|nr:VWA domain-containing protein [Verrucomicrobiota bacterium]